MLETCCLAHTFCFRWPFGQLRLSFFSLSKTIIRREKNRDLDFFPNEEHGYCMRTILISAAEFLIFLFSVFHSGIAFCFNQHLNSSGAHYEYSTMNFAT